MQNAEFGVRSGEPREIMEFLRIRKSVEVCSIQPMDSLDCPGKSLVGLLPGPVYRHSSQASWGPDKIEIWTEAPILGNNRTSHYVLITSHTNGRIGAVCGPLCLR